MTQPFAVAIGSNLGDRRRFLADAASALMRDERVRLPRAAGIFESSPAEGAEGGSFLNTAVSGLWVSDAHALLDLCRSIEISAGSETVKEGRARRLDMDLLYLGDEVVVDADLMLPHPGIAGRLFVLAPLSDLLGDRPVPCLGASAQELMARLGSSGDILRVEKPPLPGEIWPNA